MTTRPLVIKEAVEGTVRVRSPPLDPLLGCLQTACLSIRTLARRHTKKPLRHRGAYRQGVNAR